MTKQQAACSGTFNGYHYCGTCGKTFSLNDLKVEILSRIRKKVEGLENYHWHNPTGKKLIFEDEVLNIIDS